MRLLVSACLLGVCCRYDGKSKGNEAVLRLAEKHELIPVCPEQLGGLPTPRPPAEIQRDRVINRLGQDVTAQYQKGAEEALHLCQLFHCELAVLKARSPSCGCGLVYDGCFSGTLVPGDGCFSGTLVPGDGFAARLLRENGIKVLTEENVNDTEAYSGGGL